MYRPLIAAVLCFCTGIAGATELHGLRVWTDPEKTRAVIDLDGSVEYRLFTLSEPDRVVVDMDAAALKTPLQLNRQYAGVIDEVRHGAKDEQRLRVVFDLKASVTPRSFLLEPTQEYGHRLVIDLYPAEANPTPSPVKEAAAYASEEDRDVIIAVDAGHGGEDPGAIGPAKTYEKDVVLAIARELANTIDAEPGMRAVLIRDGDYYIPHRQRYEKARAARADMFVSIHADAFHDRRVTGSSVFVLSRRGASSEAARLLAKQENRSDLVGGVRLNDKDDLLASVLLDLSQNATMEASHHAASEVLASLKSVGKTHKKRVEAANFMVLKSPDVPSLLVETAFISNPSEEKRLRDRAHQRKLARAITAGIRDHFTAMPPPGTWIAANRRPSRHLVSRGDTLGGIAARYQVSLSELRQANRLRGDKIMVGKRLVIPSG